MAGVQDASDLQTSSNERPVIPSTDANTQHLSATGSHASQHITEHDNTSTTNLSRASRASLPLNRQPSHRSFRSGRSSGRDIGGVGGDAPPVPALPDRVRRSHETTGQRSMVTTSGDDGSEEDFAWGPSHPCFPHPNPHCDPDSEEARTTRVIRVRRDWLAAGDMYPQFANLYPEILDPLVTDAEFRFLISNLNDRLKAMYDPFRPRAWVDSLMGVLTGFVWDDLGLAGTKRKEKGVEQFLDEWNETRRTEGRGEVRVISVRRTGLMSLDFVVPDPGIEGVEMVSNGGEGGIGPAL
jgi:hypothetical protein